MAARNEYELLWGFSLASALIILIRLGLRKFRRQKFTLDDYLVFAALIGLLIRLGVLHGSYVHGTNFMTAAQRKKIDFTAEEIRRREIGAKLSITARGVYTAVLWLLKFAVLSLCYRLIQRLSWARPAVIAYAVIFLAAALSVLIVTYTECQPFSKHWQVVPDPGKCPGATKYLTSLFVTSIATDIMLVVLPLTVIFRVERPFWEKVRLILIFCVGFLAIGAATARMVANYSSGAQVRRATWGSIELIAETIVANFPTIYGLVKTSTSKTRLTGYAATCQSGSDGYVDLSTKGLELGVRVTTDIEVVETKGNP